MGSVQDAIKQGSRAVATCDEVEKMLKTVGAEYYFRKVPKGGLFGWRGESGDSAFFVASGGVDIFVEDAAGRQRILARCTAGEFLGFQILRDDCVHTASGRAYRDSLLLGIPKASFFKAMHENPQFCDTVLTYLIGLVNRQTREVVNSSFLASSQRVCLFLLECIEGSEPAAEDGPAIINTSSEIANLLGMSRNSVTTVLTRLQKLGAIEKKRGKVIVKSPEKLEEIVSMEEV